MNMTKKSSNPSARLIRESATLQLKLVADGMRDAVLIPISIVATLAGLFRGGDEPDREYNRVIKLGRRSERWINLFGHQQPLGRSHPAGSIDKLLHKVEAVVVEQYDKARSSEEASDAISKVLQEIRTASSTQSKSDKKSQETPTQQ
jgi:hypothetical protein